ncbi:MAG: peptide-methionine (S)-S-oxide reductase [Williamsia sp.]|nr:peptide-methionine (S)-S-oxide reductase [Williamsia sp.]
MDMNQIGFGGNCHWCTEAIFQSLKGVSSVQQGWIASAGPAAEFSEAVLVCFDPEVISAATLIAIHLHTHSCTSSHSMRTKYRSAVYTVNEAQAIEAREIVLSLQSEFSEPVITRVLPLREFKLNREEDLNYYYKNPDKPFCRRYISPKLNVLMDRFKEEVNQDVVY